MGGRGFIKKSLHKTDGQICSISPRRAIGHLLSAIFFLLHTHHTPKVGNTRPRDPQGRSDAVADGSVLVQASRPGPGPTRGTRYASGQDRGGSEELPRYSCRQSPCPVHARGDTSVALQYHTFSALGNPTIPCPRDMQGREAPITHPPAAHAALAQARHARLLEERTGVGDCIPCAFVDIRKAFEVAWCDGANGALWKLHSAWGRNFSQLWHLVDDFVTNRLAAARIGSYFPEPWDVEGRVSVALSPQHRPHRNNGHGFWARPCYRQSFSCGRVHFASHEPLHILGCHFAPAVVVRVVDSTCRPRAMTAWSCVRRKTGARKEIRFPLYWL